MKKLQITIIRPGGNDTALIKGIPPKSLRKSINDSVMKRFPSVEQVGFYVYSQAEKKARLEMAGGEFCGNATRSLAYLLLNGKRGIMKIQVSGTKKILLAGIKKSNTAFAQMPLKETAKQIEQVEKYSVIALEGITHVVTEELKKGSTMESLKTEAVMILTKLNLLNNVKASGVMFLEKNNKSYSLKPIVWVRDIKTLFYETACASGTTAAGIYLTSKNGKRTTNLSIEQPSGMTINISLQLETEQKNVPRCVIDGSVKILKQENILINL